MRAIIVANRDKDTDLNVSRHICDRFIANGAESSICSSDIDGEGYNYTDPSKLSENIDLVITVGGDGTLIEAARDLGALAVPIIGVNMGMLGFLTELEASNVDEAVDRLCTGDYTVENHMMLSGDVLRDGAVIASNFALNDTVISKSGHTHLIHFEVAVDGSFLTEYHADGMIIATPTGSTAYNLSAGGPIVAPGASMFVMTPVCSHSFTSRSVVFPDNSVISITVKDKVGAAASVHSTCAVSFDGTEDLELIPGDKIVIRKSDYVTRLVKLSNTSFIDVLRRKM